jgi:hypothetical protein
MFQLDDQFLSDIGLANLPDDQKKPFLQHIYDELELRVGTRLSDGMSDEQLTEFEAVIEHKDDVITAWLANNAPDYQNDATFARMQQALNLPADDRGLRDEYTATKWLETNRPDYRDVVAKTLEELKQEIIQNRDAILGGAPPADQPAA